MTGKMLLNSIPIVDFSPLSKENPSTEAWNETAIEISKALREIGFVYLSNHGIKSEIIDNAFSESRQFFELPIEVKRESLADIRKSYNGYVQPGQELHSETQNFELKESYDVIGNLRFFPDSVCPRLGPALTALEEACQKIAKNLLRALAISLELDPEYFVSRSANLDDFNIASFTWLRSLYYPPTWDRSIPPGAVRCAEHSDYGTLTLLFQDSLGGLEVKRTDGEWIAAEPLPNTILVNTGDLLEVLSGGVYPATRHRVLIPDQELQQKNARQSLVYFIHPDDEVYIEPLNTANAKIGNSFAPKTAKEHVKAKLESIYQY